MKTKLSNEMKQLLTKIEISTTAEYETWQRVDELLAAQALAMTRLERIEWIKHSNSPSVQKDSIGFYVWVHRIGGQQTIARLPELTDEELLHFASRRPESFPAQKVIVNAGKAARCLAGLE